MHLGKGAMGGVDWDWGKRYYRGVGDAAAVAVAVASFGLVSSQPRGGWSGAEYYCFR